MSAGPERDLRLRDRLEVTVVDGQAVVLDLATSEYFAVNESGTAMWLALRSGASEAELTQVLRARGADAERAEQDAASFLADLRARDFIVDDRRP